MSYVDPAGSWRPDFETAVTKEMLEVRTVVALRGNPVENVWQYLRANWLSNSVFETFVDIIDAACHAWRNLTATPEVITSIGMRRWVHAGLGQTL